jgi:cobalt-zinc-cadmium efflux system outer membrane protein
LALGALRLLLAESFMQKAPILALAIAGAALLASGCANTPPTRDSGAVNDLITARGAPAATWPDANGKATRDVDAALVAEKTREPITVKRAVEIAFLRSPAIRERYAELGISQAEVIEASEIPNPTFGYVSLGTSGGGPSQITRSVSLSFADLLFLPTRVRVANSNAEVARNRMAASLLELQGEVETSWYGYVAALQASQMRDAAARAAEASAEYARRLSAAGNLPPRALALELASSSEARIAAARAKADAARARAEFAALLGLSTRDTWQVSPGLPGLPQDVQQRDALVEAAVSSRLDVLGARREVAALEGVVRLTRWWRWLAHLEVGYERETETDGTRLRGPTLSFGLPIFNQNRSGMMRAQAELERARVHLEQIELSVRNDIALGLNRLATAREIVEAYRGALVPQREAVTQRTLEEVNFMLTGAFEALQAKREQYEVYQEYIEAVRDYWLARVQLRLAVGGKLADDDAQDTETLAIEALAPKQVEEMNGEKK